MLFLLENCMDKVAGPAEKHCSLMKMLTAAGLSYRSIGSESINWA